ncbi:ABC transporter permease [Streptosporangium pseudovulgare]|uniref:Dipeptide ABC transporter permease DppC n=1 Tax=Streptosporangium pseudovulgare TaxID=35765 RepID=A0ABQ2QU58_9ACTN|nr:ABC transporter permease [Streptosporangium pseudovulgare]GGP97700.1 dipeptide ABC transporter permease DppC [Streptosporangium pseudovulgare]
MKTAVSAPAARRSGGPAGRRRPGGGLSGRLGPLGVTAVAVAALLVLAALLAPVLAPYDPDIGSIVQRYLPPGPEHLLGTDQSGRDLLSRLLYGARTSLLGAAAVVVIAGVGGTLLALVATWFGGRVDAFVGRVLDLLFAFPNLLLAIIVVAVFGTGMAQATVALAMAYVPYTARVLRSVALRERRLPYVQAAELQGLSGVTVSGRHLLPNIAPQILTGAAINFGYAMIDLAALSFLGLGVQAPTADWGLMVSQGQDSLLQGYPQQSLLAGTCIVVAVAAFSVIGERLGGRAAGGRA